MAGEKRCPNCGAELPPGSLEGLCPKCLMAAGLESGAATIESPLHGSGAATSPDSTRFVPPEPASLAAHFPQLEILELLGHGGMGAVYKARQKNLDRLVALKIIRPEAADTPAFAERFNREARMLARLNHPHIVAIYDFGEVSVSDPGGGRGAPRSLYFFLMEYVDGSSLRQQMRSGELTPQQALKVVPQICDALQYAHDEGIVHRDIKPENILLDKRGRVKIADFGLAKLAARSPDDFTLTATHHVLGTVRYMAPEQMEGSHAVDHRADIYSLGVVFYEMLTHEVPAGHFEPPSKKVHVDVRLDDVVLRALAREPERRYQHASDVKDEVESICKLLPTEKTWAQSHEAKLKLQSLLAPAVGMLAIGTALTLWLALAIAGRLPSGFGDWWVVGLGGPLLLLGGIAMSGGRSYWLAFVASLTCLAIGFATLYFIFFLPFVPLAALLVGGYSLWRLMQPDVREVFGQRSSSGGAFRRRRLVITVTLVLPMLALLCAAPLLVTQFNKSGELLARRDDATRVEDQTTAPPPDAPAPAPPAPDAGAVTEGPEAPAPSETTGAVAQRGRNGNESVVRMANGGDVVTPTFAGVPTDYAPYRYDRQQITLFGEDVDADGYIVQDTSGRAVNQFKDGAVEPARLNSPVLIPSNYRLPEFFKVLFRTVPPKSVNVESGSAIELYVTSDSADIVAKPFDRHTMVEELLVRGESGRPTDYMLRIHRPVRQKNSVQFPISLQRDPRESLYTERPAETWIEITPMRRGSNSGGTYLFYDTNFEPLKPVPVVAWSVDDWPADADRARIRFWCNHFPTRAAHIAPISEVLQSPTKYLEYQPVTGVAGVELKVETITDSDRNLQIIVTERRSGVRPPSMDAIRVQLETDPAAKPIRISHQFDGKNGLATHSYYFSPGQRIYADRARILIATARDVKERAWKLASGLAVPVGRGGSFDSPASDVGTVSGQVLYFEQALRMAEVTLEALDGTEIGQETTDKDGRFTFSRVPPGKYVLKARAPVRGYYRRAQVEVTVLPHAQKPLEVMINLLQ